MLYEVIYFDKKLDIFNIKHYIIYTMNNLTDVSLIEAYLKFCADRGLNLEQTGLMVKKTKSWASLLANGKIKKLRFTTRNSIKQILGIQ